MKDFTFHNPTKLIFGKSALDKIATELKPFGNKVLLTYGKGSIKQAGIYDKVMQQLQEFTVAEFSGIEPNPRVETLREAINLGKKFKPDVILAVGGGSVIDGTKLVVAGINSELDPWELVLDSNQITSAIPLATVLTVAATGTEMDAFGVITNWEKNEKKAFAHNSVLPVISFLDPQNTYSVSAIQTAYGIVDIFSHVLEQYMTTSTNTDLQNRWSEGILLTLLENAPLVLKNLEDYNSRANIMLASTMALNGLISMGTNQDWATHDIEHELSAFYDIPHGLGLAILTPHWLRNIALTQKKERLIQYGKRVFNLSGSDNEIAEKAIKATHDFFAGMGITMNLKDISIDTKHFETMVSRVAGKVGEIPLTKEQVLKILNDSL